MRRVERLATALVATVPLALGAQAQDDVLRSLNEAAAAARYDEALRVTDDLDDPTLAAEWRSYLYLQAGDVPGALRAARDGLDVAPEHVGLLTQALNASLTLGLGSEASALSARLARASAGDPALAEQADRLAAWTRDLVEREGLARRSVARARAVALGGLAGAVLVLALLSRRAPAAELPSTDRGSRVRPQGR